METKYVIFRLSLFALAIAAAPFPALALESASYRLYDSFPNVDSLGGGDTSASYLLHENGITWTALPLVSGSYRLVTAPPAVSSSSSSEASSAASSVSSVARPPAGGHRGSGMLPTKKSPSSVPAKRPAAPRRHVSPAGRVQPTQPSAPLGGATTEWKRIPSGKGGAELLRPSALFRTIDLPWGTHYRLRGWSSFLRASLLGEAGAWESVHFAWIGMLCAILETLLLWRIFRPRRRS